MDETLSATKGSDASNWLSTYGVITVEKIFERYGMRIPPEDLAHALKNKESIISRLIEVPLKNVFNGLIIQQAKDYQVYVQKLFIDYLLSGENDPEASQSCVDLEVTRKELTLLDEEFQHEVGAQDKLIGLSQKLLIGITRLFTRQLAVAATKIQQAFRKKGVLVQDESVFVKVLYTLISHYDGHSALSEQQTTLLRIEELLGKSFDLSLCGVMQEEVSKLNQLDADTEAMLQDFKEQAIIKEANFKYFRQAFSSVIVRTTELLMMVSGYRIDEDQHTINKEQLNFDAKIGDNE